MPSVTYVSPDDLVDILARLTVLERGVNVDNRIDEVANALALINARLTVLEATPQTPAPVPAPTPTPEPEPTPAPLKMVSIGTVEFDTLVAASEASKEGDTITLAAGTFKDTASVISAAFAQPCVIQGQGMDETKLEYSKDGSRLAWGKALIVPQAATLIQGLTLAGARVPDSNGAGIRPEPTVTNLVIKDVRLIDNENGLLAPDSPGMTIEFRDCVLVNNGQFSSSSRAGYSHNVYVNGIKAITFINTDSKSPRAGHAFKSRAENTLIDGGHLVAGVGGRVIDIPNGGALTVRNAIIETPENANQGESVGFGQEGLKANYTHSILFENCTFKNLRGTGSRVYLNNQSKVEAVFRNCTFVGNGTFIGPHRIE